MEGLGVSDLKVGEGFGSARCVCGCVCGCFVCPLRMGRGSLILWKLWSCLSPRDYCVRWRECTHLTCKAHVFTHELFLTHQAELHHVEKNFLDYEPKFGLRMLHCRYSELFSWHPIGIKSLSLLQFPDLFISGLRYFILESFHAPLSVHMNRIVELYVVFITQYNADYNSKEQNFSTWYSWVCCVDISQLFKGLLESVWKECSSYGLLNVNLSSPLPLNT